MTTTLAVQILIYFIISAVSFYAVGYNKGRKDGQQIGFHRGRAIAFAERRQVAK